MNQITSIDRTDTTATVTRRRARGWARLLKAAWAALEGELGVSIGSHYAEGIRIEALEARQLFNFDLTIAAPASVTSGQQFYIYAWTSDGTMSGNYTVNQGDGTSFSYAPSATSRVTAIPVTFSSDDSCNYTLTVQATDTASYTATQSYGLDDAGNYPANSAGPTTYVPTGTSPSTYTSANGVVVDPVTGYTYVAESYYTSSSGYLMALTRLDSNDLPDTSFGTLVSGSTYTGTFLVPSFGGGSDFPYAAAVLDADGIDEVALAGSSNHGMAVAIVNVSGTGSVVGSSDYDSQTMPNDSARAVTFDSSNDVIAAGTIGNQTAMEAVALYGITDSGDGETAGELDSSFASSGLRTVSFGCGTDAAALAIMQEPDSSEGGNSDLVLGGWTSPGSSGCETGSCCFMTVVGLEDSPLDPSARGTLDTSSFDCEMPRTGLTTGSNEVNISAAACTAGFNGCYGCSGGCCGGCCGGASTDSVL